MSPNGNLLIARRFDAGRIGVAFGLSSERREFGSDNVETGGAWSGNRLTGFELRDYLPNRERHALSVSLDWRPDATRQLYLRAFASQFSDSEVRDRLTIGSVASTAATPGGAFAEGQSVTARAERRLRQRKYTQEIQSVVAGAEAELAGWGGECLSRVGAGERGHAGVDQRRPLSAEQRGGRELHELARSAALRAGLAVAAWLLRIEQLHAAAALQRRH